MEKFLLVDWGAGGEENNRDRMFRWRENVPGEALELWGISE